MPVLRGAAALLACASLVAACGDDETSTGSGSAPSSTTSTTAEPESLFGTTPCPAEDGSAPRTLTFDDRFERCVEEGVGYVATFDTTEGRVVVELDTERVPAATSSFVALSLHHYYDDTSLFRTDPSIGIIQGGAPTTQDNGDPGPGYTLLDEGGGFQNDPALGLVGPFTYAPGMLVLARTPQPDSSGAQLFFTVTEDSSRLDQQGSYIVLGRVTEGLEVLEAILALHEPDPTSGLGGAPSRDVTVRSVAISRRA